MPRTATIVLEDQSFVVPAPNIGQLERIAAVFAAGAGPSTGFGVLRIAMERADPKPDFETLAPSIEQVQAAVENILTLSGLRTGLQQSDANPPVNPGDA